MKLSKDERALLEKLLAKAKLEDEIKRAQGVHGILGGKPPQFPPCTAHAYRTSSGKMKVRHRWERDGICKCGVVRDAEYRHEDRDGQRIWYVKDGDGWRQ